MTIAEQILALQAEYHAKLAELQDAAAKELEEARAKVAALESALSPHIPVRTAPVAPKKSGPIDETDAGNGVREIEENTSAASFKDELAMLRQRTQEKRRRLQ